MGRLQVDTDQLRDTARAVRTITAGLSSLSNDAEGVADAFGHSGLADAYGDYVNGWRIHRERLLTAVEGLAEMCDQVAQAFEDVDYGLAGEGDGRTGDGATSDPPASPEPPKPPTNQPPTTSPTTTAPTAFGPDAVGTSQVSSGGAKPVLNPTTGASVPADVSKLDATSAASSSHLDATSVAELADPGTVQDASARADLSDDLVEAPFVVAGIRQHVVGHIEGMGDLLGLPGQDGGAPTVTAVLTADGTVVDIADLEPTVDEAGRLTGLKTLDGSATVSVDLEGSSAVTPEQPDTIATVGASAQTGGGMGATTLTDAASTTLLEDPAIQEQVESVRDLLGRGTPVSLGGTDADGEPTLTIAGVAGISLAALVALGAVAARALPTVDDVDGEPLSALDRLLDAADAQDGDVADPATADVEGAQAASRRDDLLAQLTARSQQREDAQLVGGAPVGANLPSDTLPQGGQDAGTDVGQAAADASAGEPLPGSADAGGAGEPTRPRSFVGGMGMAAGLGAMGSGGTISAAEERRRAEAREAASQRKEGQA